MGAKDNGPIRASIEVISGNSPVKHAPVRQAFEVVGEPRSYQAIGSVVGAICTLDAKRGNKFGIAMLGLVRGRRRKAVFAFNGLSFGKRLACFPLPDAWCYFFIRKCGEKSETAEHNPIFCNKTAGRGSSK